MKSNFQVCKQKQFVTLPGIRLKKASVIPVKCTPKISLPTRRISRTKPLAEAVNMGLNKLLICKACLYESGKYQGYLFKHFFISPGYCVTCPGGSSFYQSPQSRL